MKTRRSDRYTNAFRKAGLLIVLASVLVSFFVSPLHAEAGRIRRASSGSGEDTAAETAGMIRSCLSRQYDSEYDEELGWTKDIYHDEIILTEETGKAYPALAKTVAEYNQLFADRSKARSDEFTETLKMMQEEGYPFYGPLTDRQELYIRRADPVCFSFVRYEETYDGGAHGYYSWFGISVDPVTGDAVALEDIVNDANVLPGILSEKLQANYPDTHFIALDETLESYTQTPQYDDGPGQCGFNWCLDPQGITFFFSPYELASYADGAMEVTLLFEEYPEIFSAIYGAQKEGYALHFSMFEDITFDAGNDGVPDTLKLTAYPDEYDTYTAISLFIDGEEYTDDEIWAFEFRPVLMYTDDGRTYLYIEMLEENDYRIIEVYDLSGEEPAYAGRVDGGFAADGAEAVYRQMSGSVIAAPPDPDDFSIEKWVQILSTMHGTMRCAVGADGLPEEKEDCWVITGSGFRFTLKQSTSFERVDESGKVTEQKADLRKGTELSPYRTDTDSFVDVRTADGSIYRVYVDTSEGWPQTVNGIPLDDLFDGILFAG